VPLSGAPKRLDEMRGVSGIGSEESDFKTLRRFAGECHERLTARASPIRPMKHLGWDG